MSNTVDLDGLVLARDADLDAVTGRVHEEGACILPGFLREQSLRDLRSDFERLFESIGSPGVRVHQKTKGATALAVYWDRANRSEYPGIAGQLNDAPLGTLTNSYFGEESLFPQKIFAVRTLPSSGPVDKLPFLPHTDRLHMLKFFLYLTDVTAESGATRILRGAHLRRKKNRREWLESGKHQRAFDNVLPVSVDSLVPVEGEAGTLVILDTDLPHAAGQVHAGNIREIIRIDTMNLREAYGPKGRPRSDTLLSKVLGALGSAKANYVHMRHGKAS